MFPHLYYRTDSELMLQEVRGPVREASWESSDLEALEVTWKS